MFSHPIDLLEYLEHASIMCSNNALSYERQNDPVLVTVPSASYRISLSHIAYLFIEYPKNMITGITGTSQADCVVLIASNPSHAAHRLRHRKESVGAVTHDNLNKAINFCRDANET